MYRIVGILGPSGSGKDTLLKELIAAAKDKNIDFHEVVLTTTRPKRDYEVHGRHYWFISKNEFNKSDTLVGSTWFNNWGYAIDTNNLSKDKTNVVVLNPKMALELKYEDNIQLSLYRLYVDDKERLLRQLLRESKPNCKEICRRFLADEEDSVFYSNLDIVTGFKNDTREEMKRNVDYLLTIVGSWKN